MPFIDKENVKYFAYGSNMDPERIRERGVEIMSMSPAVLPGYELVFNKISSGYHGEGFANIMKNEYSVVEGILYETNLGSIHNLDRYENYPVGYNRLSFDLICKDYNRVVKAHAYIAQANMVGKYLKPRRDYLRHLTVAEEFLSEGYLGMLNRVVTLD